MSTTFYAILKLKPEEKKDILYKTINNDVLGLRDSINKIDSFEVGHRAGGWKFSWYPFNRHLESLTKAGIEEFVRRDDVIIYDEYGDVQDKEEFLKMAFEWEPDGWDSLSYGEQYTGGKVDCTSRQQSAVEKLRRFGRLNISEEKFKSPYQADFENDGLRWTILE